MVTGPEKSRAITTAFLKCPVKTFGTPTKKSSFQKRDGSITRIPAYLGWTVNASSESIVNMQSPWACHLSIGDQPEDKEASSAAEGPGGRHVSNITAKQQPRDPIAGSNTPWAVGPANFYCQFLHVGVRAFKRYEPRGATHVVVDPPRQASNQANNQPTKQDSKPASVPAVD